ncbi:MAG: hypothetical protein U0M15_02085 [Bacillota bacterium]|nr:hypothetical protein [Bacillota bacterium]
MSGKMSQKLKIRLFLGFAIICWGVVACWAMYSQQQGSAVDPIYPAIHGDVYSNSGNFRPGTQGASLYKGSVESMIVANPLDDKEATGEAIALFAAHHRNDPVILVCFEQGIGSIPLYGDENWQTSYGVTNVNREFLNNFEILGAVSNNDALGDFQDLGAMMTYLGYHMPGLTVAPLVLDASAEPGAVKALMKELRQMAENSSVVVMLPQGASNSPLPSKDESDLEQYFSDENHDFSVALGQKAALALMAFHQLSEQTIDVYAFAEDKPETLSDLMIVCGE